MPIPLKAPQQWSCNQCNWRQAAFSKSDVLLPKPEKCPKCGGSVGLQSATLMSKISALFQS